MKQLSLQKFSMIGILLTSISAIASTFLSGKGVEGTPVYFNGSMTYSDDNLNGSCVVTNAIDFPCYNTLSRGSLRLSATSQVGISDTNWSTFMDFDDE
jgi:hypothetical protein